MDVLTSSSSCMPEAAPSKNAMNDFSPVGMHVLVVDDDPLCLLVLEKMFKACSYKVTTSICAKHALDVLRDSEDCIDLVLSDVYMPDIDGFKLLEIIGLELDLPVIMMSANGDTKVVMEGIAHGACDYLIKPVRMEELKNIWQHVVRKKQTDLPQLGPFSSIEGACSSDQLPENFSKRCREVAFTGRGGLEQDAGNFKRARVSWTVDLHQHFVNAVNQLGVKKAVPKKLLDVMNVKGLTRESVASHLQKYRLYLKRLSGVPAERRPIASFQALEDGKSGGAMCVFPGGRSSGPLPPTKGLNVGEATTESDTGGLGNLASKQQRNAERAHGADAFGFLGSQVVAGINASSDMGLYMQATQTHLHSTHLMPSLIGGMAWSGAQNLKLEDMGGGSRRTAQVEGFVSPWNINPGGKAEEKALVDHVAMLGSLPDFASGYEPAEGTQVSGGMEMVDDPNGLHETSEGNAGAFDLADIPEQQNCVLDYLLENDFGFDNGESQG